MADIVSEARLLPLGKSDTETLVRRTKLPSSNDSEQILSNLGLKYGKTKLIVQKTCQNFKEFTVIVVNGYCVLCYCRSMQYIDREGKEEFYGLSAYPDTLYKKVTLLKYFRSYMSEHLLKVRHFNFASRR